MATEEVLTAASTVVAGTALLLGSLTGAFCASPRAGLRVFLDLLLAAGLLRLATADTWTAIATVAAVVAIRKVVVGQLRTTPDAVVLHRAGTGHADAVHDEDHLR